MPLALAAPPPEVLWATAFAVAGLLLLAGRGRPEPARPLRERVEPVGGGPSERDVERAIHWLPQAAGFNDRRRAARRAGPPTPVRVAWTPGGTAHDGLVLDRSAGGLCLATDRPHREGAALFVRPEGAAADCPWVAVAVRNCRACKDYFLAGVAFDEPPPLTILLQFG